MDEVTRILQAVEQGDTVAAGRLLPLVYEELRRLAAERLKREAPGQTLQATALVHEAYLRLVGVADPGWQGRGHFFAAAAEAMRRVLINRARDNQRIKRGGGRQRVDIDLAEITLDAPDDDILALDEALERLEREDPGSASVVKLRFFGGLTQEQTALAMGIPVRTADRRWAYARAWLYRELRGGARPSTS